LESQLVGFGLINAVTVNRRIISTAVGLRNEMA